jgi:hypothetical protein
MGFCDDVFLSVLEMWMSKCEMVVCEVRLPQMCWWLSTLSAKYQLGLFAFTGKPRLCHDYHDG